jgi:hypothetical protein
MVYFTGGVLEASLQVLRFEIRQLLKNLRSCQASGEEVENIGNTNTDSSDARTPPALVAVDRNA